MNILVIDNEPKVLKGLQYLIENIDPICTVRTMDSAESALAFIEVFQPDIVFTDIRMGNMDGITFIRIAKGLNNRISFVIVSGYDYFEYAKEALNLGVADFVLKPITRNKIENALNKALEQLKKISTTLFYKNELLQYYLEKLCEKDSNHSAIIHKVSKMIEDFTRYCIFSIKADSSMSKEEITSRFLSCLTESPFIVGSYGCYFFIFAWNLPDNSTLLINSVLQIFQPNVNVSVSSIEKNLNKLPQLLMKQCRVNEEEDSEITDDVTRKIIQYIKSNYAKKITLEDVSDYVYMNATYISKLFKKSTGINLSDFITELRINKAKELLRTSDMKVYEISERVGFNSSKYFINVFRSKTGVTPSNYKNIH